MTTRRVTVLRTIAPPAEARRARLRLNAPGESRAANEEDDTQRADRALHYGRA